MYCRVLALLFVFTSCGLLPSPSPGDPPALTMPPGKAPGPVTSTAQNWTDLVYQWWWMGLVLTFLFPQIRGPFVHLFKTIFQTLALPFQALLVKYGKPPAEKTGLGEE